MADKGIINERSGSVTITGRDGAPDVVLLPGANRLTIEQYDRVREDAVFRGLRADKLLRVVALDDAEAAPEGEKEAAPQKGGKKGKTADPADPGTGGTSTGTGEGS